MVTQSNEVRADLQSFSPQTLVFAIVLVFSTAVQLRLQSLSPNQNTLFCFLVFENREASLEQQGKRPR
jgi:hypothetical protein